MDINKLNTNLENLSDEKIVELIRKALDESSIPYTITDNGKIDFDGLPIDDKEV